MERIYIDSEGIQHDLDIFESQLDGDTVYTIHKNGNYFLDLIFDDDAWCELYGGKTERSVEYGQVISRLLVI